MGAAAAVLTGMSPSPGATPAGADVGVGSDGTRVRVTGYRAGGDLHYGFSATADGGGVAMVCRELLESTGGMADSDIVTGGWPPLDPQRRALRRYWLECRRPDGSVVALADGGLGYLYADEVVDFDAEVRTLAERYVAEELGPSIDLRTSPPVGLVGIEQWFWVEGYDGAPVVSLHDVVGHRVELTLEPATVAWSFGDGSSSGLEGVAGLGRDATDGRSGGGESPVAHRYRDRSTSAGAPDGDYEVAVTIELSVRYTLDGAGPFDVEPPLSAAAAAPLVVREAQAVLHR